MRRGRPMVRGVDDGQVDRAPPDTASLGATRGTTKTPDGGSVGVLEALTARETAEVQIDGRREERLAEPLAGALVARATKEYRHGQTRLGAMFTILSYLIFAYLIYGWRKKGT